MESASKYCSDMFIYINLKNVRDTRQPYIAGKGISFGYLISFLKLSTRELYRLK